MSFKSKAQQRWMSENLPELAQELASQTPKNKQLPERVGLKSASEKRKNARRQAQLRKLKQPLGKLTVNKVRRKIAYRGELS